MMPEIYNEYVEALVYGMDRKKMIMSPVPFCAG